MSLPQSTQKQTLILLISRHQLDPTLIPPLKLIIPMLSNLYPLRLFTSVDNQIKPKAIQTSNTQSRIPSLYEQLVKKLQQTTGYCSINETLSNIMQQYDALGSNNYRVCIIGHDRVDWHVVMEYKRRGIVIDTVCSSHEKSHLLVQISYITEGIHRMLKQSNMVKAFQSELGMSSKIRGYFKIDKKETVQFSLKCYSCSNQITGNFLSCSICLSVYCIKHQNLKECMKCQQTFD